MQVPGGLSFPGGLGLANLEAALARANQPLSLSAKADDAQAGVAPVAQVHCCNCGMLITIPGSVVSAACPYCLATNWVASGQGQSSSSTASPSFPPPANPAKAPSFVSPHAAQFAAATAQVLAMTSPPARPSSAPSQVGIASAAPIGVESNPTKRRRSPSVESAMSSPRSVASGMTSTTADSGAPRLKTKREDPIWTPKLFRQHLEGSALRAMCSPDYWKELRKLGQELYRKFGPRAPSFGDISEIVQQAFFELPRPDSRAAVLTLFSIMCLEGVKAGRIDLDKPTHKLLQAIRQRSNQIQKWSFKEAANFKEAISEDLEAEDDWSGIRCVADNLGSQKREKWLGYLRLWGVEITAKLRKPDSDGSDRESDSESSSSPEPSAQETPAVQSRASHGRGRSRSPRSETASIQERLVRGRAQQRPQKPYTPFLFGMSKSEASSTSPPPSEVGTVSVPSTPQIVPSTPQSWAKASTPSSAAAPVSQPSQPRVLATEVKEEPSNLGAVPDRNVNGVINLDGGVVGKPCRGAAVGSTEPSLLQPKVEPGLENGAAAKPAAPPTEAKRDPKDEKAKEENYFYTEFEVLLERPRLDTRWGFDITTEGFQIKAVNADGILGAWNLQHRSKRVGVGDFITHINGKVGNAKTMLSEMKEVLKMKLRVRTSRFEPAEPVPHIVKDEPGLACPSAPQKHGSRAAPDAKAPSSARSGTEAAASLGRHAGLLKAKEEEVEREVRLKGVQGFVEPFTKILEIGEIIVCRDAAGKGFYYNQETGKVLGDEAEEGGGGGGESVPPSEAGDSDNETAAGSAGDIEAPSEAQPTRWAMTPTGYRVVSQP